MKSTSGKPAPKDRQPAQADAFHKGFRAGQRALIGRLLHVVQQAQTIAQARRDAKALLSDLNGGR